MIPLAYLLSVAVAVVVLAVALRRHPAPAPTTPLAPVPTAAYPTPVDAEVRRLLVAAVQLAARLDTAA